MSKLDLLPARGFDLEGALRRARTVHPDIELFLTSARTGEGIDQWYRWIEGCVTRPGPVKTASRHTAPRFTGTRLG